MQSALHATDIRDLQRSSLGTMLLGLSKIRRLRLSMLKQALRLEGGEFHSLTARLIMERHFGVVIGAYSYGACFNSGAFNPGVTIGRYVSIGPDVLVYRRNHPADHLSTHPFFYNPRLGRVQAEFISFKPLEIGADAWIGARVIVTPGCSRIGLGSVVGAGSVLTRDVPDFAIVGGAPARVIRLRFPEKTCELIRASGWWLRSIDECIPYLESMIRPLDPEATTHPLLSRRIDPKHPLPRAAE